MASVFYFAGMAGLCDGSIDFDGDTIKAALLMTNTTADSENAGIANVDDFGTLDECDSAGYTRKTLGNPAVNIDTGNARIELDADDVTWTALAACTRDVQGVLIYKHVSDDSDSIPILFVDFASDLTPDGSDVTIPWNAEGIAQLSQS
jgi:hypothetical protein